MTEPLRLLTEQGVLDLLADTGTNLTIKFHKHVQAKSAKVWVVDHGFGMDGVNCIVYDADNIRYFTVPFEVSLNQLEIHHGEPRTGRVICYAINE